MASLSELARERTTLSDAPIEHLKRLVRTWGLLADLSFADLVLYAPLDSGSARPQFVALAHVRPATGQTVYIDDIVATLAPARLTARLERGMVEPTMQQAYGEDGQRLQVIPVVDDGEIVAVVTSEQRRALNRDPSLLERSYLRASDDIAAMITEGTFPFRDLATDQYRAPRVGDGVLLLDEHRRVTFSSPNAVSALHRIGFHNHARGARLDELGLDNDLISTGFARAQSVALEIRRGPQQTINVHCLPFVRGGRVTGGMALLRDVTELRRRDLMILSKDATIREIHHRVKNNLQTVSSLLRLQARRLESQEAKDAIAESSRRIASIAIVHETLAQVAEDAIDFDEVLRPLVRLVQEGISSPDRPMQITVHGRIGVLDPEVATPLAVVVTELLQNAADHAFTAGTTDDPSVRIELDADRHHAELRIVDNGAGLPDGLDKAGEGLGLTIVRTLVEAELHGRLELASRRGAPGTEVRVTVPLAPRVVPAIES